MHVLVFACVIVTSILSWCLLMQTLYESFLSCDVSTGQLESETYDTVQNRIRVENSHIDLLSVGKS